MTNSPLHLYEERVSMPQADIPICSLPTPPRISDVASFSWQSGQSNGQCADASDNAPKRQPYKAMKHACCDRIDLVCAHCLMHPHAPAGRPKARARSAIDTHVPLHLTQSKLKCVLLVMFSRIETCPAIVCVPAAHF